MCLEEIVSRASENLLLRKAEGETLLENGGKGGLCWALVDCFSDLQAAANAEKETQPMRILRAEHREASLLPVSCVS